MASKFHKNAQRVQDILNQFGYSLTVVELPDSTRTAQEAASAIGCTVNQIAKSLIFRGKTSQQPILIISSGINRVNEKAVAALIGESLEKAEAAFVLAATGFAIGGIPPIGHKTPIRTYLDEDLFAYDEIWAAAGTPHAVFRLTPDILKQITQAEIIKIT